MKRRKKNDRRRIDTRHQRKMSEMIWEVAGDFITMGETPEERQSLVNAACSAWSIACAPPEHRQKHLDQYIREYSRCNPGADQEELEGVRSNIEQLVERKLEMFPTDLRHVVGARLISTGGGDRLEIMSVSVK